MKKITAFDVLMVFVIAILAIGLVFGTAPVKAANDPSPRFVLLGNEYAGAPEGQASGTFTSVFVDKATGVEWVCFRYGRELSCSMTGRKR